MNFSGAAVIGKIRAMYGKRLSGADWESLTTCHTIKETAAYLKNNTAYHDVLEGFASESIHRQRLENLLQERVAVEAVKLSRYDTPGGINAAEFIISIFEIEQILTAFMRIASHDDVHDFTEPSRILDGISRLDQRTLDKAETFGELVEAVKGTPYYEVIKKFRNDDADYSVVEHSLQNYNYIRIYKYIEENTSSTEKESLKSLFDEMMDLINYGRILRMKRYFKASANEIMQLVFQIGGIRKDIILKMAQAETEEEVTKIMQSTRTGKKTLGIKHTTTDELTMIARQKRCKKNILYSTHSGVVMISYVFFLQTELSALIHVIESVRYDISKSEIKNFLSLYGFL